MLRANQYALKGEAMQTLYDTNAPKKPTNLSLNGDLLKKKAFKH
jgi:hypothetical protein